MGVVVRRQFFDGPGKKMGDVSVVRVWHWSVTVCHELNRTNRGIAVVFDYYTTPLRAASNGRALAGVGEEGFGVSNESLPHRGD